MGDVRHGDARLAEPARAVVRLVEPHDGAHAELAEDVGVVRWAGRRAPPPRPRTPGLRRPPSQRGLQCACALSAAWGEAKGRFPGLADVPADPANFPTIEWLMPWLYHY